MRLKEIPLPVRTNRVRVYYIVLSHNRRIRHTRYRDLIVPFHNISELDGRNKITEALFIDRAIDEVRQKCLLHGEEFITHSIVRK